jgi:putative membrane-bound dehydrogenase-like protein
MLAERSICFRWLAFSGLAVLLALAPSNFAADANRLTYLDETDPFYPTVRSARLTTPQWVGEPDVEAVVILAIDDMRDTARYETFLRPILDRLKRIDGRAPVSIMVNAIDPANATLQTWLKEGLSLDVHTLAHPCPLLAKGNFQAAADTYHGCIDLMARIPGNKPVAFRMPCCDSMNSPSPRFYAEIFNRVSAEGRFLSIDSSVMCILTTNDPVLPRNLVLDADGREKFRKYLPSETNATTKVSMKSFVTTIENYPYPYVIGKLCWEFPAMVPSDWEAFNLLGPMNAATLADWKAALDAVVLKQGVFNFIFHPHGWSSPHQFIEFIEYAMAKHGTKVKFLTFREAQERIDKHLLGGVAVRGADGHDNGVRLLDLNDDGFTDVLVGNDKTRRTRVWEPTARAWRELGLPVALVAKSAAGHGDTGVRFGIVHPDGHAALVLRNEGQSGAWHFDGQNWSEGKVLPEVLKTESIYTSQAGSDRGVRFRDIDNDGSCELLVANPSQNAVFKWSESERSWTKLNFALPRGRTIVDGEGRDAGLRFVDVNSDGRVDVLFSDDKVASLHLFVPSANPRLMWEVGWNDEVFAFARGDSLATNVPPIVRASTNRNNGAWFARDTMWVQNEDTAHWAHKVDRCTFHQLLNADTPPPLSPEESLAALHVRPGFKVELVAAEPFVETPIAFDWGEDGKLWVVEMRDYPLGLDNKGQPGGRIKCLEDLDGDGRYDKAAVFLDGIPYPSGVMPWRNGVLVSAAPEIFYAEDIDGDGKADVRKVLFTGFTEGNQQHRINGFDYGLDHWLYCANGDSGGKIKSLLKPDLAPVSISGRDFRFQPDTGECEAIEGETQYGRRRDDWGNWFGNANYAWLWHYYIAERYLARNPHLTVKSAKQMLADYPESTRLYPTSRTRQRFNDKHHFNHVTSGCSPTPYRDDLFGPDFATSVFISDPVHNVVHREVLEADGATFKSHRAADETNSEFLASSDNWFRPTMLKTGPDGALYLADMYRLVLEHPEWIPKFIQPRLDLRAGEGKGRIYRVVPTDKPLRKIPRLDRLDKIGVVAALESPNGWQRDTAQRLLMNAADQAVTEPVKNLVITSPDPKVRLQALWTLEGQAALTPDVIQVALKDSHPAVREQAVRLAESLLSRLRSHPFRYTVRSGDSLKTIAQRYDTSVIAIRGCNRFNTEQIRVGQVIKLPIATNSLAPEGQPARNLTGICATLVELVTDPQARVRYQLALAVGAWDDARAGQTLARLALRDAGDPLLQTAILSSATNHVGEMLAVLLASRDGPVVSSELIARLIGLAAMMKEQKTLGAGLAGVISAGGPTGTGWKFGAFASFLDALDRQKISLEQFTSEADDELRRALEGADALFAAARVVVNSAGAPENQRLAAIRLLGREQREWTNDVRRLSRLMEPQNRSSIQQAALKTLTRQTDAAVADVLLASWTSDSPAVRNEVLDALLSRLAWTQALLAAVERGEVPAGQISPAHRQKLFQHSNSSVREQANKLFAAASSSRAEILKNYASVSTLVGDAAKGFALFKQNCAACHRLRGEGSQVGPDLGSVSDKSTPALLVSILDPNQAVEWRYVNYMAVLKDDRELSGIMAEETPNSVTLRGQDGREETLLRADLKELRSSGLSLMPEGLESALRPQDMADLLAALQGK